MDLTWLGVECDSILDKKYLLEVISHLPPVHDLRIGFHYNNCMYAVVGSVIEQQSGRPWYEFLKERILEPLRMHRTERSYHMAMSQNLMLSLMATHCIGKSQLTRPLMVLSWD